MTRAKPRCDIERIAAETLRRHGLYEIPVDPVVLANREGIKVHNALFKDDSFAGMIAKRGGSATVLVNRNDPPYRKRFTIAHELGHHFLHLAGEGEYVDSAMDLFRESDFGEAAASDDRAHEIEANKFAAALLMPEEFVRKAFSGTKSLAELAQFFNVSENAMGIRLQTLGLL